MGISSPMSPLGKFYTPCSKCVALRNPLAQNGKEMGHWARSLGRAVSLPCTPQTGKAQVLCHPGHCRHSYSLLLSSDTSSQALVVKHAETYPGSKQPAQIENGA